MLIQLFIFSEEIIDKIPISISKLPDNSVESSDSLRQDSDIIISSRTNLSQFYVVDDKSIELTG